METYNIWYPASYPVSQSLCILQGLLSETSSNATVLTITSFTVERYIAICHPFRYVWWIYATTSSALTQSVSISERTFLESITVITHFLLYINVCLCVLFVIRFFVCVFVFLPFHSVRRSPAALRPPNRQTAHNVQAVARHPIYYGHLDRGLLPGHSAGVPVRRGGEHTRRQLMHGKLSRHISPKKKGTHTPKIEEHNILAVARARFVKSLTAVLGAHYDEKRSLVWCESIVKRLTF